MESEASQIGSSIINSLIHASSGGGSDRHGGGGARGRQAGGGRGRREAAPGGSPRKNPLRYPPRSLASVFPKGQAPPPSSWPTEPPSFWSCCVVPSKIKTIQLQKKRVELHITNIALQCSLSSVRSVSLRVFTHRVREGCLVSCSAQSC